MTRLSSSILALPLLAALGACSSSFEDRYQAALPVEQRLPFEISSQVTAVSVATDSRGRLTPQAQSEVAGLLQAYKSDGSGVIQIQLASGGRSAAQAEGEIRDLAAIYGIPRSNISVTGMPADAGGATVRVAYARYVASVPGCENPDWSENLAMTWDNSTYPNFGCSMQKNMAAMAADPRDLLRARPMDTASAERRDTRVGKYEKGESPSAARTPGDSGKVADTKSGTEKQ
ncbi:MAG: CpaD family pilus assembly protein [Alphaproteobacteria bacterium]